MNHTTTARIASFLVSVSAAVFSVSAHSQGPRPPAMVSAIGSEWRVEGGGREADVKAAPFLGREALWLRNGTQAIRVGDDFTDGTIEFDVAPMDRCDFVALVFRRASLANHENLYLRVRQSAKFMALQYAPRTNGSATWQLYPEFNVPVTWPRNAWTRVRVGVRGSRLDVFVGDGPAPVLSVPRLRLDVPSGGIAVWARVNDAPDEWAAAVANLRVVPTPPSPPEQAPPPPSGYLARWQIAGPVPAPPGPVRRLPDAGAWTEASADEAGLVNLNRHLTPGRGRFTVLARTTISSPADRRVRAGIGYSDDVTVFVNGEPVFSGVNGWQSRAPEYASFVDARHESVWLPLRAGPNELVLAVTDDQLFGWGFAVRLEPEDASALSFP